MSELTLEERVAALEGKVEYHDQNFLALNEATTDTATAVLALIGANQTKINDLSETLEAVLQQVCPFPPECGQPEQS